MDTHSLILPGFSESKQIEVHACLSSLLENLTVSQNS